MPDIDYYHLESTTGAVKQTHSNTTKPAPQINYQEYKQLNAPIPSREPSLPQLAGELFNIVMEIKDLLGMSLESNKPESTKQANRAEASIHALQEIRFELVGIKGVIEKLFSQ